MQRVVDKPNRKPYFERALAKSGAGFRTPEDNQVRGRA